MSRRLAIFDLVIAISFLVAPLAWVFDPFKLEAGALNISVSWGWKPVLAPVALLVIRRVWKSRAGSLKGPFDAPLARRVAVAWAAVFIAFLAAEGALALLGLTAHVSPVIVEHRDDDQGEERGGTVPDPELIWKLKPGSEFNGRRVNSLGFLDREVERAKPAGARRVICLGDSCTAQGTPPYSGYLNEKLRADPPTPEAWEAFNMAVHGYSVRQGKRLFEALAVDLDPDVVTVFFGWNDHWLSDRHDVERMAVLMPGWRGRMLKGLQEKRWFVLLMAGSHRMEAKLRRAGPMLRVPPDDYAETLAGLCGEIAASGAQPMLISAPRATHLASFLERNQHASSVAEAERLHDEYVEITRAVAAREGAALLDLAAEFAGERPGGATFSGDGIHFRQAALERVADAIHRKIKEMYDAPAGP